MTEQKTEQQEIEEMAKDMEYEKFCFLRNCTDCPSTSFCSKLKYAKTLVSKNYRKQSDVANEIIQRAFQEICPTCDYEGIEIINILKGIAAELGAKVKE